LDNFSELEAELEAELEFRNIQYEHYNNKLLDFDNNQSLLRKLISDDFLNKEVKTYKLTEVAKISNGDRITKSELLENGEFTVYNGSISIFGTCNK
jgi:type I restriction enzyme specificity protein